MRPCSKGLRSCRRRCSKWPCQRRGPAGGRRVPSNGWREPLDDPGSRSKDPKHKLSDTPRSNDPGLTPDGPGSRSDDPGLTPSASRAGQQACWHSTSCRNTLSQHWRASTSAGNSASEYDHPMPRRGTAPFPFVIPHSSFPPHRRIPSANLKPFQAAANAFPAVWPPFLPP